MLSRGPSDPDDKRPTTAPRAAPPRPSRRAAAQIDGTSMIIAVPAPIRRAVRAAAARAEASGEPMSVEFTLPRHDADAVGIVGVSCPAGDGADAAADAPGSGADAANAVVVPMPVARARRAPVHVAPAHVRGETPQGCGPSLVAPWGNQWGEAGGRNEPTTDQHEDVVGFRPSASGTPHAFSAYFTASGRRRPRDQIEGYLKSARAVAIGHQADAALRSHAHLRSGAAEQPTAVHSASAAATPNMHGADSAMRTWPGGSAASRMDNAEKEVLVAGRANSDPGMPPGWHRDSPNYDKPAAASTSLGRRSCRAAALDADAARAAKRSRTMPDICAVFHDHGPALSRSQPSPSPPPPPPPPAPLDSTGPNVHLAARRVSEPILRHGSGLPAPLPLDFIADLIAPPNARSQLAATAPVAPMHDTTTIVTPVPAAFAAAPPMSAVPLPAAGQVPFAPPPPAWPQLAGLIAAPELLDAAIWSPRTSPAATTSLWVAPSTASAPTFPAHSTAGAPPNLIPSDMSASLHLLLAVPCTAWPFSAPVVAHDPVLRADPGWPATATAGPNLAALTVTPLPLPPRAGAFPPPVPACVLSSSAPTADLAEGGACANDPIPWSFGF